MISQDELKKIGIDPANMPQNWSDIASLDLNVVADQLTLLSAAGSAANFLPGVTGGTLSAAFAALDSKKSGLDARSRIEQILDLDLEATKAESTIARDQLKGYDQKKIDAIGESVAGTTGAIVGTIMFPVVGSLIGSIAGSLGAQKAYKAALASAPEQKMELMAKMRLAEHLGIEMPPEAFFAASMMGASPAHQKIVTAALVKRSRGKYETLADALAANEIELLQGLMKDYDTVLKDDPRFDSLKDDGNGKTVSELLAESNQRGELSVRALVFDRDHLAILETQLAGNQLAASGVYPATDGEMPSIPPAGGNKRARSAV